MKLMLNLLKVLKYSISMNLLKPKMEMSLLGYKIEKNLFSKSSLKNPCC